MLLLAGVNFATGQALDIERLTAAGHAAGAIVLWDLAHAAGNVELALHDWDVDGAAWCTYKYLNGGPGGVGAMFVHERFHADPLVPRLAGWWGEAPRRRFAMDERVRARRGRRRLEGLDQRRSWRSRRWRSRWRSSTRSGCRRCGRARSR